MKLAMGSARVSSNITLEKADIQFAVLHLGDHNFIGGADHLKDADFASMHKHILAAFAQSNVPEIISQINRYFGSRNYSLWHLFKQEQMSILNQVLRSTMEDIESSFRQIYEHHYPLMQIKNDIRPLLPRMLTTVVEFILNRDLSALLESADLDIDRLRVLVEEMKRWSFKRDQANFSFLASGCINKMMARLQKHPEDVALMEKIAVALELLEQLQMEMDLWKTQNIYFVLGRTIYPDIAAQASADALAQRWVEAFGRLGEILKINITALLPAAAK